MNAILTIFKKEWDRVIKDKRLVLSVMLLPGLMIFLIYSIMGNVITDFATQEPGHVAIVNPTAGFTAIYSTPVWGEDENGDPIILFEEQAEVITIPASEAPMYRSRIDEGDWDLLIIFPEGLESNLAPGYQADVEMYHNQNENQSSSVQSRFAGYLTVYAEGLRQAVYGETDVLLLQTDSIEFDDEKATGMMMSTLLPMLVVMFLFSGAMSIGPESIAGEKERGTMATLLITPVKRSEIALGKVSSLSVLALISALSSFLGIISSLPKMMGMDVSQVLAIYNGWDLALMLVLLFSTVFVIVGLVAVVSAFSKSLKEAGTLIMPLYIITIVIGITSMFSEGAVSGWWYYLLPMYNTVQSLTAILLSDPLAPWYVVVTVIANLTATAGLIYLLTRMFHSEKIMFAK
jgi:sodium transport system permease protein